MANILDIKPLIRNFIEENLDKSFKGNVYWLGERFKVPPTPFCLLSVISERKDKRTSTHNGRRGIDNRNKISTIYKFAVITIAIYNDAIGGSYDEKKEFAYSQINRLEQLFETKDYNSVYSIENIGAIRPLHEVADGGYQYRFEFDLTIGYNETVIAEKAIGEAIQVEIANNCPKDGNMIGFVVERDDEDDDDTCKCNIG